MESTVPTYVLAADIDPEKIDAVFADLDQSRLPGAAVGIAVGGKPLYRKGFGLASMELPVVLSPAIRMRIFSTTKHFACLSYLLLCEEGRAGIDDPIGKYLPELNPIAHDVTMRQLMGHIGGLRDAKDIALQFSGKSRHISSADLLSMYLDIEDVNAPPGTTWIYNNGGYSMLTTAIERIAAMPLEDVLAERVFQPVGMHDTLLRRWDSDLVPNSASLHMTNPAGGYDKSNLGIASAAEGGIVSTVNDMLRWLAHMDAPVVGSPTTWAAMKTPQRLSNGTSTGYGLGLMSGRYRGVDTLYHPGGGFGGNSQMLKVPAAGLDIIVMVNRHDVSAMALADRILDSCLPSLEPIRPPRRRQIVSGVFHSPTTGRVVQLRDDDDQQIASIDGWDVPIESDDDGVFRPTGGASYLKLELMVQDQHANPESIRLIDFGNMDELVAVSPSEPNAGAIVGRYRSTSAKTEISIRQADDGLRLDGVGPFGHEDYLLQEIGPSIWRIMSNDGRGGILSLDADGRAVRFSTSRTRKLAFRRFTSS